MNDGEKRKDEEGDGRRGYKLPFMLIGKVWRREYKSMLFCLVLEGELEG